MKEDQFIWEPYSDELIESLPDYCCVGRNIWRARVTIFCWDVVEVHLPDRVIRQFGMIQEIPPTSFPFDPTHFNHDRRGRPNTNWELEHEQWLPFWHQRLRYVINAPVNHEPLRYDDPYLVWFRRITRLVIGNPTSRPQRQQGYVPNATAYEAMVRYIHSVVDKAKSLDDQPLFEEFYMFRAMVQSEGEKCLTYVHEADRIHLQADYEKDEVHADHIHPSVRRRGKGGVAGRRERAIKRGEVSIEMDEMHQEDTQAVPEDDPATKNCNIGSTSRGDTYEFTQASGMTYQPTTTQIVPYMTPQTPQYSRDLSLSSFENIFVENGPVFNSSPVQMSIDIPEATNRDDGQDFNIEIQGNKLDDSNNEVDGEPSMRQKRKIIHKRCATGSHFLDQHGRIKKQRGRSKKQQGRSKKK